MQFSVLIAALFASAVAASPLDLPVPPEKRGGTPTSTMPGYPNPTGTPYDGCPDGLFSNPQCCATDILGVADLDCHSPPAVPRSAAEFRYICATGGQRARCCVIPVLGQALLCETPVGV
ncbi:fungal hydrophobin-domain-containing protein [Nemania serpens]|nr:fungal hydrophobin-domain-containing protein [Nemania serpens]